MTILVAGAGAAGMMAATAAKENNPTARVILLEKNAILGRKVIISGGGRCNVTTGVRDVRELLTRYPRGGKFLTTAMYHFTPEQVYDWFIEHGVPLKIEEDNRVFPVSNNGKDVVGAFERYLPEIGVEVLVRHGMVDVEKRGKQFAVTIQAKTRDTSRDKNDTQVILADKIILTTGGEAYRHTGSTGDGYHFAEALGHTISPLSTSLNSFVTQEAWPKQLSGVSFEKIGLRLAGDKQNQAVGPALFTHQGITGPAVFIVASHIAFEPYDKQHPKPIVLDFLPGLNEEQIAERIRSIVADQPKLQFKKALHQLFHPRGVTASLIETMLQELNIDIDISSAETSKTQVQTVAHWLHACTIHAVGRGAGAEFVTAGGVELKEVNPQTMESLLCPGLFFAGEILNMDGYTGGFNLQAAWATGRLAGEHAGK